MADKQVAVVIDFYNPEFSVAVPLYLCKQGPLSTTVSGVVVGFEPVLVTPIVITVSIPVDVGHAVRGSSPGGTIQFALNYRIWPYLPCAVKGRTVSIYEGNVGDAFSALALVFVGRVVELTHDTMIATMSVTDARYDLDQPFVVEYFDDTYPDGIKNRPCPIVFGQGYSLAPVLTIPATYQYRLSSLGFTALEDIFEVRVGGVPWEKVGGAPGAGAWQPVGSYDLIFGGTTENGEVRADARAAGWQTTTTASLVESIATAAGATVDATRQQELNAIAPWLVGYFSFIDPINSQDALDQIMAGVGGWWCGTPEGKIVASVHHAPALPAAQTWTVVEIQSLTCEAVVPPACRVQVEWKRNWHPATSFFANVPQEDQQSRSATGILMAPYDNPGIKTAQPKAVELPTIRSLVVTEVEAQALQAMIVQAFGVERRVYNVSVFIDVLPVIYNVVTINYHELNGTFRVISIARSIGGGAHKFQVWG